MNFHFSARTFGNTRITILFSRKRDGGIELERRYLLLSFWIYLSSHKETEKYAVKCLINEEL